MPKRNEQVKENSGPISDSSFGSNSEDDNSKIIGNGVEEKKKKNKLTNGDINVGQKKKKEAINRNNHVENDQKEAHNSDNYDEEDKTNITNDDNYSEEDKTVDRTRSKSRSLDTNNECADDIDKLRNGNNLTYKKKKSTDEINGKVENWEDQNMMKNNQKIEYRRRKSSSKEIKCYKDLKHLKEYANVKSTNNRFTNFIRFYGYRGIPNNGSKNKLSISSQNSTSHNINLKNHEWNLDTFKTRCISSIILIFLCSLTVAAGHFYCSILVLILVSFVYREIISLKSVENKDKKLPEIFYIRWYWFFLTILTWGIPWIIPKLKHQIGLFKYMLKYHSIIMFISAFFGLIWFILSLRKFSLKYQFSQIGIILLSSLFIVTQSLMHIANIYSGLIWFIVPVTSVAVNDSFAYIFGVLFGKTRLIELSPKKTVEGFVGSSVITVLYGIGATYLLQNYKFFICPQNHISFIPFSTLHTMDCENSSIFKPKYFTLPSQLSSLLSINRIYYTNMVLHGLVLSLFAAFLAPFGGFFASGFKRALKIKDFGHAIPGHGGATDRFDCQVFIGMFTYIYLKTFVKIKGRINYSYDVLIDSIQKLDHKEVLRLFNQLKNMIDKKRKKNGDKKKDHHNKHPSKDDKCNGKKQLLT
ncbi:cytidine diphosphate-diacylglycerol synthase [Plasmodium knowlesi strain H]|uniref:phosphatidate cytidylyltransferase n=3 Tax=Plasmodium knowlesi TaxID=5850 RepID=A0A5K1UPP4_PLAKH|nr:cytidine diphosphate-diacylglycerol synthase [Plasmodium knowlesi strain H]OTN67670.1 putative Cytidine diphosphate-diacylglycerol synthasase [Plasmodium knowlesi]CAA9990509.1 cytidine diphosphate-diacylglycerol synthase [Plasmodium knowlesi strain H]SBO19743.1 cytidine diphosphate-diacylglycerol synthase [Plasmodium knowlesi strain H]SBO22454.1 cytidine diphosphate-diacylglycerol synthase [Plasmodium knowlesi strain H]VVS79983.1 cytidine diphosphate-diacylglycerol synthase [Plasmodium know|eukprot:XP_002260899.1 cytidine diphosphate-diacylglycerol synthasase,putative [Plasmodium knowlesi strain H]